MIYKRSFVVYTPISKFSSDEDCGDIVLYVKTSDGIPYGSLRFSWAEDLGGSLEVWDDSFRTILSFTDVFGSIEIGQVVTHKRLIEILNGLGIEREN